MYGHQPASVHRYGSRRQRLAGCIGLRLTDLFVPLPRCSQYLIDLHAIQQAPDTGQNLGDSRKADHACWQDENPRELIIQDLGHFRFRAEQLGYRWSLRVLPSQF